MDHFTFGMFGELQDYEDRLEYEEWLDQTETQGGEDDCSVVI